MIVNPGWRYGSATSAAAGDLLVAKRDLTVEGIDASTRASPSSAAGQIAITNATNRRKAAPRPGIDVRASRRGGRAHLGEADVVFVCVPTRSRSKTPISVLSSAPPPDQLGPSGRAADRPPSTTFPGDERPVRGSSRDHGQSGSRLRPRLCSRTVCQPGRWCPRRRGCRGWSGDLAGRESGRRPSCAGYNDAVRGSPRRPAEAAKLLRTSSASQHRHANSSPLL